MQTVGFIHMEHGTKADYELLGALEQEYAAGTADRILALLQGLKDSMGGYQVDRYEHSLQTATLAFRDGASEERVVAALLHDLGDGLAPHNHSDFAAAILKPYVSEETVWVVKYHGLFQGYYYAHFYGGDRHQREQYRDHPYYQACVDFCEKWDQKAFDPDYDTLPLSHFEPMVRRLFAREPFAGQGHS